MENQDLEYREIELKRAIVIDGVQVKTLKMREPTVRDLLLMEKTKGTDSEKELALFANLCEVPKDALLDLTARDYRKLQDAYRELTRE